MKGFWKGISSPKVRIILIIGIIFAIFKFLGEADIFNEDLLEDLILILFPVFVVPAIPVAFLALFICGGSSSSSSSSRRYSSSSYSNDHSNNSGSNLFSGGDIDKKLDVESALAFGMSTEDIIKYNTGDYETRAEYRTTAQFIDKSDKFYMG